MHPSTQGAGERILRELQLKRPRDKRVLRALGRSLCIQNRLNEALVFFEQAEKLPGGDPWALYYHANALLRMGRFNEGKAVNEQTIALTYSGWAHLQKLRYHLCLDGDLHEAIRTLAQVPIEWQRDDLGASTAFLVWYNARQPEKALGALSLLQHDFVQGIIRTPADHLRGRAHRMAGRNEAARTEWRAARDIAERRLAVCLNPNGNSNAIILMVDKAYILACLGERAEAERALHSAEEWAKMELTPEFVASIDVELGKFDEALAMLTKQRHLGRRGMDSPIFPGPLRINPAWDPIRNDPRFRALVVESENDREPREMYDAFGTMLGEGD